MRPGGPAAHDVLNALSISIAVLDANGEIVAVNDAWKEFARTNGAREGESFVGANYLHVCERALAATGDRRLAEVTSRLRALLGGTGAGFSVEYDCHTPTEQRWFQVTATPMPGASAAGAVVAHEEITQRKRVEKALRETERRLLAVLEALPVGVWIMDRTGLIVHGNRAGRQIWGGARYVGPEEFGEYRGRWLDSGRAIEPHEWAAARAIAKGETSINEKIEIECFDGTRKIIQNSAIPLFDERRKVEGAIIVNEDITAQEEDAASVRRAKREVEEASKDLAAALERERILSRLDTLTGATSRRHFIELAVHELAVAARYEQSLSLIIFDIDNFKRINDTHGHQAGDQILQRVAEVGRLHLRGADLFGRYGGDEFIALLPQTTAEEAEAVAERVRADVALHTGHVAGGVTVTISSGIAERLVADDTLDALVHRADLALYEAKNAGRDRTSIYRESKL